MSSYICFFFANMLCARGSVLVYIGVQAHFRLTFLPEKLTRCPNGRFHTRGRTKRVDGQIVWTNKSSYERLMCKRVEQIFRRTNRLKFVGLERMLLKLATGNGERESGNECTAVTCLRIQNGGGNNVYKH